MRVIATDNVQQFGAMLREYKKWCPYDWKDIVNRKALSVAFEALKETVKAKAAEIKALESKDWWPKYIAKRITGKGVTFKRTHYQKVQSKRGIKRVTTHSTIHYEGKGYTREEARRISKLIISARLRSIGFLKSGWLPAIRTLWPLVKDKPRGNNASGARQYGANKGEAVPAVASANPHAVIKNSTDGIEKYGELAVSIAIDRVIADTFEYIKRKMTERVTSVSNSVVARISRG